MSKRLALFSVATVALIAAAAPTLGRAQTMQDNKMMQKDTTQDTKMQNTKMHDDKMQDTNKMQDTKMAPDATKGTMGDKTDTPK